MEKNNKTLNVPHLRFPEFSGEWENLLLNDIVLERKKRVPPSTLTTSTYISTENMLQNFAGVSEASGVPSNNVVEYKIGDILISNIRPYLKKIWLANQNGGCSSDIIVLSSCENYDGSFVYYLLANDGFISYVMSGAKGLKMPRGDKQQILKYGISIPSLKEQRKIAMLLDLLDQRIETQKKIIEKYESLIRGLYQFLFQQAKYDHFVSLGDISQISNGNSDVKDASMYNDGSLYPFFDRSDEIKFLPEYLFDKEAIIYPGEGAEFYPRYYNGKFALHQRCYAVYDISTDFIPRYLYHYCKTQNSYFVRNAVGSTVASLRLDTFKRLKIPAIPTHHQESLVMFLDKIEAKIECNRTILKKYKEQKKYLLFTLFI